MSMTELGHALRPQRTLLHSLLLSVLVVAGVALALVAMHSLSLDHSSSATSNSAAQHDDAMTLTAGDSQFSDECAGSCAPEHSMVVMVCVLALVSAVLIAARIRMIASWKSMRRTVESFTARLSFLRIPEPPSLHVLSISRN